LGRSGRAYRLFTLQPYYRARYGMVSLPGASAYYEKALSLPLFPHMADEDVDRVVVELQEALGI
jgi:dTDP-4-amino-4,6-dideoxygalactose transaminase